MLCAMESRLRLEKLPPAARIKPVTARSGGQRLLYQASRATCWIRTRAPTRTNVYRQL